MAGKTAFWPLLKSQSGQNNLIFVCTVYVDFHSREIIGFVVTKCALILYFMIVGVMGFK